MRVDLLESRPPGAAPVRQPRRRFPARGPRRLHGDPEPREADREPPAAASARGALEAHLAPRPQRACRSSSARARRARRRCGRFSGSTTSPTPRSPASRSTGSRRSPRAVSCGRSATSHPGFVRGLEVSVELDEQNFVGSACYLFASVLERFLVALRVRELLQPARRVDEAARGRPASAGRRAPATRSSFEPSASGRAPSTSGSSRPSGFSSRLSPDARAGRPRRAAGAGESYDSGPARRWSFPPSEIHDLRGPDRRRRRVPPRCTVAFVRDDRPARRPSASPTPSCSSSGFATRTTALWEFLDLFNHRFLSLFYRAWEKYRFPIVHERRRGRSLHRVPVRAGRPRHARSPRPARASRTSALLLYAGLIAQRPHSASALEGILRDYFGVPAAIAPVRGTVARSRAGRPIETRGPQQQPRRRPRLRRPRLEQPVPLPDPARAPRVSTPFRTFLPRGACVRDR